ncbi:carbohydrate-binding protein [Lentisphaera marina]|uniref:carbohydrate-binding protein n=1 Tax=Lentisphaera marina TaxID=1111041 RepID=UPI002366ED46|nr:carbohydrate-binding protein [Lentisphaera marina]MDD7986212.1 carbohydrate-binding protein [Lentisphaera marina]
MNYILIFFITTFALYAQNYPSLIDSNKSDYFLTISSVKKIEAETFNKKSQGMKIENCSEGGKHLAYINNGHWIMFKGINIPDGFNRFTARVSCGNYRGGTIELRIGSQTGKLIGSCAVKPTGDWTNWETVSCEIKELKGTVNLYLVFTGNGTGMFNLNYFGFEIGPTKIKKSPKLIYI